MTIDRDVATTLVDATADGPLVEEVGDVTIIVIRADMELAERLRGWASSSPRPRIPPARLIGGAR